MAENSGISWTDNTFNPWMGCTKISPACKNCYAERDMDHRHGKVAWGPFGTRVLTTTSWPNPLKWNQQAAKSGNRIRVFCASLADVFEDWQGPIEKADGQRLFWSHSRKPNESQWHWVPESETAGGETPITIDDIRLRLFDLIDTTPYLDWLLLTKRPENILRMWKRKTDNPAEEWCNKHLDNAGRHRLLYRHNVWLGTSVESQEYAEKRIPELLMCRDLSPVLFLSCEPLVGPVNLTRINSGNSSGNALKKWSCRAPAHDSTRVEVECTCRVGHQAQIDWVITGGESGPGARPNHPEWFRSLRDQAKAADVPFHFKQWGEWGPESTATPMQINNASYEVCENGERLYRVGKKAAGRLLDGVEHNAFPEVKI